MKNPKFESIMLIKKVALLLVMLVAAQTALAHDGHHTSRAWESCETKAISDGCSYVMQTNQLYKGTCQQMASALMCVRNQPIKTLSQLELKALAKLSLKKQVNKELDKTKHE